MSSLISSDPAVAAAVAARDDSGWEVMDERCQVEGIIGDGRRPLCRCVQSMHYDKQSTGCYVGTGSPARLAQPLAATESPDAGPAVCTW